MAQTLVSVIVPTCNRPHYLRQALASIRALESDDLKFEILVGDNGDPKETRQVAADYDAVYLRVQRTGAGAARNAGLRVASGDYIAFLDDDDVWLNTNIRGHVALLQSKEELDGAFAQIVCTDMELRPTMDPWPAKSPGEGDELVEAMLSGYYPQLGGTVVRRGVRDEVGLFDETLLGDQDWDWQLRVARRRKMGFVPQLAVLFRQRPPGSFDKLRMRRLGFSRKVFFRHAVPEWKLFRNPRAFMRAYTETVRQYFDYFVDAAVSRAEARDRGGALGAIWGAFCVFPLRALYHITRAKPLRHAVFLLLHPPGADIGAVP